MTAEHADPRARLMGIIDAERASWRDVVDAVGPARLHEPGPMGEWSFIDLAGHLLGWRERTILRLEAAANGAPEPPSPWPAELDGDDDAVNDWMHARTAAQPPSEVLAQADASFDRLAAAIAELPDAALSDPAATPWLEGESLATTDLFGHWHDEHEGTVRAWLASRS